MALTRDSSSLMMWTVFQNLVHDSANFTPTETETVNYADQLLHGLINNETFKETVSAIATEIGRTDVVGKIDGYARANEWIGDRETAEFGARGVMQAIAEDNPEGLVNLADSPSVSILPLNTLEKLFDVHATIQETDTILNTHIIADERFIAYFDQYVAATEMSGEAVTNLRADIVAKHQEAVARLDTMEYDGVQMAYANSASSFYMLAETGNMDALGYEITPDQNIFDGLEVAQPVSTEVLTATNAPLPHVVNQEYKERIAYLRDNLPSGEAFQSHLDDVVNGLAAAPIETEVAVEPAADGPPHNPLNLTREEVITKLHELQASEDTYSLDVYKQGLVILNPEYEGLFAAIDETDGFLNTSVDPLQTMLNGSPEGLETLISLSDDTSKLNLLTQRIEADGHATDFMNAVYQTNDPNAFANSGTEVLSLSDTIDKLAREQAIANLEGMSFESRLDDVVNGLRAEPPAVDTEKVVPEVGVDGSSLLSSFSLVSPAAAAELTPEIRAHFSGANIAVAEAVEVEPEPTTYTVERGDTLWAIAREEYGLTDYKDIMQAVDHIANDNGLANGTDANHIQIGQVLNMPTAEEIQQPVQEPDKPLDWQALDSDPNINRSREMVLQ